LREIGVGKVVVLFGVWRLGGCARSRSALQALRGRVLALGCGSDRVGAWPQSIFEIVPLPLRGPSAGAANASLWGRIVI